MGIGGEDKGMRKMPSLWKREFENHRVVKCLPEVTEGCEWVIEGEGWATEKVDGSCCAIIGGRFWRRYDAKKGQKRIPNGAIPCQPKPDPVTGHWPHWVPVYGDRAEDKWYTAAYNNAPWCRENGTYEAVGPHFQSNPYGLDEDVLEKHGRIKIKDCPRDFDGMREYLRAHDIEGIVWYRGDGTMCKVKRSDFGFAWPVNNEDGKRDC